MAAWKISISGFEGMLHLLAFVFVSGLLDMVLPVATLGGERRPPVGPPDDRARCDAVGIEGEHGRSRNTSDAEAAGRAAG